MPNRKIGLFVENVKYCVINGTRISRCKVSEITFRLAKTFNFLRKPINSLDPTFGADTHPFLQFARRKF